MHSRRNFTATDARVQFETFDSSLEERREEKLVFKFIQRMDFSELEHHLHATRDRFNVQSIFDKSGYSPIHYAAYKNIEKAVEILINFALFDQHDSRSAPLGEEAPEVRAKREKARKMRKQQLRSWVNTHSRGDDGFTALHFAAFHGNMSLIRLLVRNGANVNA